MSEWSRNTPWRQGRLLTQDAVEAMGFLHTESPDDTVVIVATHDCDLAQTPDREPDVEIVVGRRIQSLDGNYTHAKISRTLHVRFEGDTQIFAEFVITDKRSVPKRLLADFEPDPCLRLLPNNLAIFQIWLASRYRRSAFPDEFERRLKGAGLDDKISKAVKPHGELITAVFFDVDEGQEITRSGEDDIYLLDIYLLHVTEPDYDEAEAASNKAKAAIESAFKEKLIDAQSGDWKNIELRYVEVISEETLSYRQSKFLKKWRLDHLSLGQDPQQPVMAEY